MSFYLLLDIKQQQEYSKQGGKNMSQTHHITAILNVRDNGATAALNNVLRLIHNVAKTTDSLKKLDDAFKQINERAGILGTVVGHATDSVKGFSEFLRTKVPIIKNVNAALVDLKTKTAAVAAGNAKATVYTKAFAGAQRLAGYAAKFFKFALKAIPILLIIGGIIALVNGIRALIDRFGASGRAAQENAQKLDRLRESTAKSAQAHADAKDAIDNQSTSANQLATQLETLSKIENRSADDKERMRSIINDLESAYGNLNIAIDKEGNLIGKSINELRAYIRERNSTERFAAIQNRQNELTEEYTALLRGQEAAEARVNELRARGRRENSRAMRRAMETLEGYNDLIAENSAAVRANGDLQRYSFTAAGDSIEVLAARWNVSVSEITQAMEDQYMCLTDWEARQSMALNDLANQWGISVDEIIAEMEKYGISQDQWAANQQSAWEDTQASIRQHTGNIINNFRELPASLEKCAGEMADILYRNRQIYNEWQQNLSRASEKVSADVLRELEAMGTGSNQIMNDLFDFDPKTATAAQREAHYNARRLVEQIDAGVQDGTAIAKGTVGTAGEEVGGAYAEGFEYALKNVDASMFADILSNAADETVSVAEQGGRETGEAYVEGVTEALESVDFTPVVGEMERATSQMANNTADAMNAIKSITRETMEYLNTTIVTNMDQAETSTRTSLERITAMFGSLRTTLPANLFIAGSNALNSLRLGILSREPAIMETVNRIASNVQRTMRRAMQMNSPSRVMMKLGRGTMGGFALGMERMQSRVSRVVYDTADLVKSGLDKALAESKLSKDMTLTVVPEGNAHQNYLMERLIDAVEAGKNIIMDSGELVGATYGQYDAVAGQAVSYNSRWGR